MQSTRPVLFVSSALVALIAALFSYRQHHYAADAVASAKQAGERITALRTQIADVNKQCADLEAAVQQPRRLAATPTTTSIPPAKSKAQLESQKRAAIAEALARQKVRRYVDEERYLRPVFEKLGLSTTQWEAFRKLGVQLLDARFNATAQGLKGVELQNAMAAADAEFQRGLRQLIGEEAAGEVNAHQTRLAEFGRPAAIAARGLTHALIFSDNPLSPQQADRIKALVEANVGPARIPGIPAAAVEQAQAFLTPAQMTVWRQLQDIYRLDRELDSLVQKQANNTSTPAAGG